jgi:hypothetical protein
MVFFLFLQKAPGFCKQDYVLPVLPELPDELAVVCDAGQSTVIYTGTSCTLYLHFFLMDALKFCIIR